MKFEDGVGDVDYLIWSVMSLLQSQPSQQWCEESDDGLPKPFE